MCELPATSSTLRRLSICWTSLRLFLISQAFLGCASTIHWVQDSTGVPSCLPDRPATWDDFTPRSHGAKSSAETVVSFRVVHGQPSRLEVQFDPNQSWVNAEVANTWNRFMWTPADELLRHEQLHFAISCLLTRQANVALSTGEDPEAMLMLLKAVATRINAQYDVETNHGRDPWSQRVWEQAVELRFKAGFISSLPVLSSGK